jgi:sn-glycerol 3-phosphate transport system substrate-binding protein
MKKYFVLLCFSFIFFFALGLTGCADDEQLEGNGEIYVDKDWDIYPREHVLTKPVEIDFWSANSAVDIHGTIQADLVDRFNAYQKETYPDSYIKVNISFQGGYVNQNTKLQAGLIGKTNPEMAMVGVSSFALYVDNVIDMRQIFTYDEIRDIYEGFLQFAMYRHKFIGYPYYAATNIFLVNRTLAEATGMVVPTVADILANPENSIWTWDYFKQLTQAISEQATEEDVYGLATTGVPLYESFYTQGLPIYNETATEILFNNEAGIKAFTFWRSLVVDGSMVNPVLDPNHGTKIQGKFAEGKVGFLWNSSSVTKSIFENVYESRVEQGLDPLFEIDVLPHPQDTNFYSNQSGGGLIVFNNKPENKTQATIEFLRWLQAPEQSAYFSVNTGYLATTRAATQTQIWLDYAQINPLLDRIISLMVFAPQGDLKLPIGRAKALADDDFAKYSKGIYYDNCTRDIQDVLNECAERIQYILQTNSW